MQYINKGQDKKEPKVSTTTIFPVVEELTKKACKELAESIC